MPYIDKVLREDLKNGCSANTPGELNYLITLEIIALYKFYVEYSKTLSILQISSYNIERLCYDYVEHNGLKYQTINDVIGVLNCAVEEFKERSGGGSLLIESKIDGIIRSFYRKIARPYEDKKCQENGDVYD